MAHTTLHTLYGMAHTHTQHRPRVLHPLGRGLTVSNIAQTPNN